ncbi:hypothetical protein [Acidithrix ferrooxidans]|uniref:hypothetical protein n=1 Tax=Acidithrix ferrooxidans TaxID=1280514 RepID=UPI00126A326E|nr:hypothetical protein [Acidithrix ferrooxidans]
MNEPAIDMPLHHWPGEHWAKNCALWRSGKIKASCIGGLWGYRKGSAEVSLVRVSPLVLKRKILNRVGEILPFEPLSRFHEIAIFASSAL